KIADAYGAQGIRAETMKDLEKAIKTAIKSDVATVIDIPIDPDEDVYPFVAPGSGLKDMIMGS
ncbi:MAG TPA: thiamine pyrophosphate-dependent enzyme, partial [Nitrososphaera sp.]|nr:thiamine pyrophosphate-dependent enzyme [Nitrososphaera sp.]